MSGTTITEPTFIEHLRELRRRLLVAVICIGLGAAIGWSLFGYIIDILSRPFQQTLFYSAPTGELSFMVKVCIVFGVIFAAPILFYQILKFIQPALNKVATKQIILFCGLSVILACGGIAFAYFVSLPFTLQFLLNMENSQGAIEPLISVDEYFNFVLAYMAGFALLFQIPLFVLIINKITPLTPGGLFKSFRYVILFSFIAAAIITPTPDPINQAIMAVPVIVLYFISALCLLFVKSVRKKPKQMKSLKTAATTKPGAIKARIPAHLTASSSLQDKPKVLTQSLAPAQSITPPPTIRMSKNQFMRDIQTVRQAPSQLAVNRQSLNKGRIISDFL